MICGRCVSRIMPAWGDGPRQGLPPGSMRLHAVGTHLASKIRRRVVDGNTRRHGHINDRGTEAAHVKNVDDIGRELFNDTRDIPRRQVIVVGNLRDHGLAAHGAVAIVKARHLTEMPATS